MKDHAIDFQCARAESESAIDELIARMHHGDWAAAAEFMFRYGSRLRRRIRGKIGPSMRRIFDSDDILSTVARRLDVFVRSGGFKAANEAQVRSLLFAMAEHAIIEKSRTLARFRKCDDRERENLRCKCQVAREWSKTAAETDLDIPSYLHALNDNRDRRILECVLAGDSQNQVAKHTAMSVATVRKRWKSIRARLRRAMAQDYPNDGRARRQARKKP